MLTGLSFPLPASSWRATPSKWYIAWLCGYGGVVGGGGTGKLEGA